MFARRESKCKNVNVNGACVFKRCDWQQHCCLSKPTNALPTLSFGILVNN